MLVIITLRVNVGNRFVAFLLIFSDNLCFIPYSGFFSRAINFANFANDNHFAKINSSNCFNFPLTTPTMCAPVTLYEIQLLLTGTRLMTLYRYFKQEETLLPSPNGSLSKIVPSTVSIVNREVKL